MSRWYVEIYEDGPIMCVPLDWDSEAYVEITGRGDAFRSYRHRRTGEIVSCVGHYIRMVEDFRRLHEGGDDDHTGR